MDKLMNYLPYIIAVVLGYFLGCINPAYIIAKIKGVDVLAHGSKNPGASNATITMGWKVGIFVGFFDIMKAFISVMAIRLLFPDSPIAEAAAGVACVLGHMFPVTFKFRGGKGFASFLGMVLALDWRFFIAIGIAIILITLITDYLALGTLTTVITEPILLAVFKGQYIVVAIVCIASLVIILKHLENIKKIATGQEIGLRRVIDKNKKK